MHHSQDPAVVNTGMLISDTDQGYGCKGRGYLAVQHSAGPQPNLDK